MKKLVYAVIMFIFSVSFAMGGEVQLKEVCITSIDEVEKFVGEKVESRNFDIKICYPQIVGGDIENSDKINDYIFSFVRQISKRSIRILNETYRDMLEMSKREGKTPSYQLAFHLNYKVGTVSDNFFSGYFERYLYLGGAHGDFEYFFANLDLVKKTNLTYYDMFEKEKEEELRRLILEFNPDVYVDSKEEFIKDKQPLNFYIAKDSIVFTLKPYEYGPYAAGFRELAVPLKKVKRYVKERIMHNETVWALLDTENELE